MVKEKLEELSINYIIVEDKNIVSEYKSDNNCFSKYTSSVFDIISINNRINRIIDKLNSIDDINIKSKILDELCIIIDRNIGSLSNSAGEQ